MRVAVVRRDFLTFSDGGSRAERFQRGLSVFPALFAVVVGSKKGR